MWHECGPKKKKEGKKKKSQTHPREVLAGVQDTAFGAW